jgi:nucleoside-diphosphate-sugar epimerase
MADVCILGAGGFVGSSLAAFFGVRACALTRTQLNLKDQAAVDSFFAANAFKTVFHCAVRGGNRVTCDEADVVYDNLLMFETVAKHAHTFEKFVYFSSGARFDRSSADAAAVPTDFYGFSKYVIEKRAESVSNLFILRIYGCFGVGELASRFLTVCLRDKHVVIAQDRLFDYVWIGDVCRAAEHYANAPCAVLPKTANLVYREKLKLSQLAALAAASFEITGATEGQPYVGTYDVTFMEFESGLRTGIASLSAALAS